MDDGDGVELETEVKANGGAESPGTCAYPLHLILFSGFSFHKSVTCVVSNG
jgi:hypothetical protein